KFFVTYAGGGETMDTAATSTQLAAELAAVASVPRLGIIAALHYESLHVSELARRLEMSRALLYMHLRKLEDAGFVTSKLALSDEGKALNIYSLTDFSLILTPQVIARAVAASAGSEN